MIKPAIPLLRQLQPKLIRIDHIFDYYHVYQGPNNYNFSQLDNTINSILLTGAIPMLSISYTTADMSQNGQNAGEPKDWDQWYQLVKTTASRYSKEKNIRGIYYEVWNEPDLFGGWKYNSSPNYSTLYTYTARAVADGAGKAFFKVGGPAITGFYSNWIKSLFSTATKNQLRLDFISWHRYSKNMADFEKDLDNLNNIISNFPQYFAIEKLISEIGPNSEPDSWYDNQLAGIHLISLSTKLTGKIHRLFTFEPVDGPTPRASNSSGWGLITHPNNGLKPKPRYYALQFLNQLQGSLLSLTGNGSWVTGISSKQGETSKLLLVNYDPNQTHTEIVPITFQNLTPGQYSLKTTNYLGNSTTKKIMTTANYQDKIYMEPNTALILELTPQP